MDYYQKFIKHFGHIDKPLTMFMQHKIHMDTDAPNSIWNWYRHQYYTTQAP